MIAAPSKVPKLRFSNFSDEWEENEFGQIALFVKGIGISKDDISLNGINKCIRYGEMYTTYKEIIKDVKSRTNIPKSDLLESNVDDLLMPSSGETAIDIARASCVKEAGILLGGDLNVIRLNTDQDGDFIAYYITNFVNKQIAKLSQGYSVVHLYSSHLKTVMLRIPDLKEQRKIAEFLSIIDDWINNLRNQKELLEKYKKGMMQKIFSQEIRFKDENGKNYPEWEEKKLENTSDIRGGKRIPIGYSLQSKNNGFPYITVTDMNHGSVSVDRLKYVPESVVEKIKNYTISKKDIYISVAGTLGLVGIIPDELDGAFLTENADKLTNLRCDQSFLLHYLKSNSLPKLIAKTKTSNAQPKLAIYSLKNLTVSLPSLPEQQKIADFLNSIDKIIESKQKQIDEANNWKKGLMQKMFI